MGFQNVDLGGGYGLIIFSEESIDLLPTKVGVCSDVINARWPNFFGVHWTHIFENFECWISKNTAKLPISRVWIPWFHPQHHALCMMSNRNVVERGTSSMRCAFCSPKLGLSNAISTIKIRLVVRQLGRPKVDGFGALCSTSTHPRRNNLEISRVDN